MKYKLDWRDSGSLLNALEGDSFSTGVRIQGRCCGIYLDDRRIRYCSLTPSRGCNKSCEFYRGDTHGGTRPHCAMKDPSRHGNTKSNGRR
ncbi:hypothetical protein [Olsenella porci]|jgi:hypothetical protein|uniref:Uncharacterized protein n=1 Tax=Olsenella porci TaxID=2652279 RepID=A0A6N7XB14_9ACTN|nr:hypothetical protein [Olsenella porci]MCI1997306.1 hypothetical protein [Olsenella sp.]MST71663.1 hypothetical protein [Olsenella porci]